MKKTSYGYTEKHAKSFKEKELPDIDVWENQYKENDYLIKIVHPEFTSVCPKTGLPDLGTITIEYVPDKYCLELKSLKYYFLEYRDLGIFMENAVNRILKDVVKAAKPKSCVVTGDFTPRGGIKSVITARYQKK
ncbi:MAG TPA: preQ(1) synthase [Elusimicrobiales bacterium]|mgnify:CR=1 FL=1|nr:preQ(1) synthase [Elusimicrobiales bacterium]HOL62743.1 preQ(1) synthase [Elusimicrobiales bacterium]HPO95479.1 preQ(1) synthase [Elusimicrobiales bacterium]